MTSVVFSTVTVCECDGEARRGEAETQTEVRNVTDSERCRAAYRKDAL